MSDLNTEIANAIGDLRETNDQLDQLKLRIETETIDAAGGSKNLGSNEDERKRALANALQKNGQYTRCFSDVRRLERRLEALQAAKKTADEEYQRDRWQTRARLVDALEQLGHAPPTRFFSGSDIDRAGDEIGFDMTTVAGQHAAAVAIQWRHYFPNMSPAEITARVTAAEARAVEYHAGQGSSEGSDYPDEDDLPF